MSKQKGDRYERRYVNVLDRAGYAVMRAPSSGSATTRDLPDVFAGRKPEARDHVERIASENKYDGDGDSIVYLTEDEIDGLVWFANVFDATPVVVVRRSRDAAFYVYRIRSLERTQNGLGDSYRVTPEMANSADADAILSDGDPEKAFSGHGKTANAIERIGVLSS